MKVEQYRDLSLLRLDSGQTLVTACDSCGAVGEKEGDVMPAPPEVTGALTTRVALMEVMCAGARVQCIYNILCSEMEPTGRRVIDGIRSELRRAGVGAEALSGSTEENFPTVMTAMGVVAIGICEGNPRLGGVQAGDSAVLVATPKCGAQIIQPVDDTLVSYNEVCKMLAMDGVREIVPCGSKGVLYEAEKIAACNGLRLTLTETDGELLRASAGTATCAVVAVSRDETERLFEQICRKGVRMLGYFE